jgi:hypothetical protein
VLVFLRLGQKLKHALAAAGLLQDVGNIGHLRDGLGEGRILDERQNRAHGDGS